MNLKDSLVSFNLLSRLSVGLAIALLISACGARSEAESLAAAKAALDKRDYKTAVVEVKSALQANPDSVEARYSSARPYSTRVIQLGGR
ncbi:MAG: hypothetical protein IPP44_26125 [Ideonella sp.]|nr:hypothetical protein [Ideonella sp.]